MQEILRDLEFRTFDYPRRILRRQHREFRGWFRDFDLISAPSAEASNGESNACSLEGFGVADAIMESEPSYCQAESSADAARRVPLTAANLVELELEVYTEEANKRRRLLEDSSDSTDGQRSQSEAQQADQLWCEVDIAPQCARRRSLDPVPPSMPLRKRKVPEWSRKAEWLLTGPLMPDDYELRMSLIAWEPPFHRRPCDYQFTSNPVVEQEWREEGRPGDYFYRSKQYFVRIRNPDPKSWTGWFDKWFSFFRYALSHRFVEYASRWHEGGWNALF